MAARTLTRIVPHLWYVKEAEEAARFYVKIFPRSRIDGVWSLNDAVSFRVSCRSQAEVDRYWKALLRNARLKAAFKGS